MIYKLKCDFKIAWVFLFLLFSICLNGQNIVVDLNQIDSIDINNDEYLVKDLNGDFCSLIIVYTDLDNLKFYSNIGVEKIRKTEKGYLVWIPNNAKTIKFSNPGYPLYEYSLPESGYTYSIFHLFIKLEIINKSVLIDTLKPGLSFISNPSNAKVLVNGSFKGKTPLSLKDYDFDKFEYSIQKKGYESYSSVDSIKNQSKNINVKLKYLPQSKRLYNTLGIGFEWPIDDYTREAGFFSYSFGVLGKTGLYGSLNHISSSAEGWKIIKNGFNIGLTQQIGNSIYLLGGTGYFNKNLTNINNQISNIGSVQLDIGIIFKIGKYFLVKTDYCKSLSNKYNSIGLSLGLNFLI